LRIVKGPNVKKLLFIVSMAALLTPAMPALAVDTFSSQNVQVNWNVTANGTITLYADYCTGTESIGCGGAPVGFTGTLGGSGTCTIATSAPAANTGATGGLVWTAIAPDFVDNTECYYKNAVDAVVTTNDSSGYKVYEGWSANVNTTGYLLCESANGTVPTASATTSGVSAAPAGYALTGATTCPTGMTSIAQQTTAGTASAAPVGSITVATGASTVSNGHVGEDMALMVPANAAAGAADYVVTYAIVGN
jgi:hypothetical protein